MRRILSRFFLLFLVLTALGACSQEATVAPPRDSSLSDPTTDVVADVGPANQVILEDIQDFENFIADNFQTYIDDNLGSTDPTRFRTANTTAFVEGNDNQQDTDVEIDITEPAEECSNGGTKQLTGPDMNLHIESISDEGTLSGQYTITYTDCSELVQLQTADGPCQVETLINGDLVHDAIFTFSDVSRFDVSSFQYQSEIDITTTVTGLSIANGTGASHTIDYDLNYANSTIFSDPEIDGSLIFDGAGYDPQEISDFISTSSSAVCSS